MKSSHWLKFGLTLLLLALMSILTLSPRMAHADNPRIIEISAKRFAFTPNQITLKKGETVKLRLTTEELTHGFFMKKLKIDEVIEPGKPTEIAPTPDTAGNFTTTCDHFCGVNHGGMNMTITVVE